MDNAKTGALIQRLRKEREMTQKDLARQLHITDRAVSKWERGLCAPDISLLEPLAAALDVSVLELLAGERAEPGPAEAEAEERVRQVIRYSAEEIRRKVRTLGARRILAAAVCVGLAVISGIFLLWQKGAFCTLDEVPSPDGQTRAVVYSKALAGQELREQSRRLSHHGRGGHGTGPIRVCSGGGMAGDRLSVPAMGRGQRVHADLLWF